MPKLEGFVDMSRMNKERTLSSLKNHKQVNELVDAMYVPERI